MLEISIVFRLVVLFFYFTPRNPVSRFALFYQTRKVKSLTLVFYSPSDNDEQAVKRGYLANEYDFQGMKNIMNINFGAVAEDKTKDKKPYCPQKRSQSDCEMRNAP